jgi:hypothetical protein
MTKYAFLALLLSGSALAQTPAAPDYSAQALGQRLVAEIDTSVRWQTETLQLQAQVKDLQQQLADTQRQLTAAEATIVKPVPTPPAAQ